VCGAIAQQPLHAADAEQVILELWQRAVRVRNNASNNLAHAPHPQFGKEQPTREWAVTAAREQSEAQRGVGQLRLAGEVVEEGVHLPRAKGRKGHCAALLVTQRTPPSQATMRATLWAAHYA
jgi:hypothetical protein